LLKAAQGAVAAIAQHLARLACPVLKSPTPSPESCQIGAAGVRSTSLAADYVTGKQRKNHGDADDRGDLQAWKPEVFPDRR
jgi:hypothetical protein